MCRRFRFPDGGVSCSEAVLEEIVASMQPRLRRDRVSGPAVLPRARIFGRFRNG